MPAMLRLGLATTLALSLATAYQWSALALAGPGGDTPQPPARLDETGLYLPDRPDVVDPRNQPFSPQYPLWSDGATKSRWVYLPAGQPIETYPDGRWELPVGTRFWKEFRFAGRKVETRMLWKASASDWVAASYAWNADGTDAVLAPAEGLPGVADLAPGRQHTIPSRTDCLACHGAARTVALGFNPLQLSTDRDPNAIHGEPFVAGMVTLKTLVDEGRLSPAHATLVANPPRIPSGSPLTRAVLGYLSANCGSCHNRSGEIAVLGPSLESNDLLRDGDAVAQSLVGHRTAWQVPGVPEGGSVLVDATRVDRSALLVRMRSRRPSSQMPPLGSVVRDEAAVAAITTWIETQLARSH